MSKRHNIGLLPTWICNFLKWKICTFFFCFCANFKFTIRMHQDCKGLANHRHLVCWVHIQNIDLRDDSALLWLDETMMVRLQLTKTLLNFLSITVLSNEVISYIEAGKTNSDQMFAICLLVSCKILALAQQSMVVGKQIATTVKNRAQKKWRGRHRWSTLTRRVLIY